MTWRKRAACKGTPGDLWYPTSSNAIHDDQVAEAKAICAGCPVRAHCLADVLSWELPGSREGIWGGLTSDERKELRDPSLAVVVELRPRRLTDDGLGAAA